MADDGYGKYRRMLKMGLPMLQVTTCMTMDGKDPSKFTEKDPNENEVQMESTRLDLSLKGDQYDKYRKMLKCGLPMGAALQAMAKDGVDSKGFDLSGTAASAAPSSEPTVAEATPKEEGDGSDSAGGSGFLSELKTKAEKRVNTGKMKSSFVVAKTATLPKPPAVHVKMEITSPAISPAMFPTLKPAAEASSSKILKSQVPVLPVKNAESPVLEKSKVVLQHVQSEPKTAVTGNKTTTAPLTHVKSGNTTQQTMTMSPATKVATLKKTVEIPNENKFSSSSSPIENLKQVSMSPEKKPVPINSPKTNQMNNKGLAGAVKPSTVNKQEFSTVPKGLQKRFAWE